MMAGVDTTTIGRARVAGWPDGATRLAARLAMAQVLAGADLRPPGLAPAAILIVRRLPVLGGSRLALRPGGRVDPAWERAGRAALADLARRAARPWDEPAPPDSLAVLFRDEAEMLACLALDVNQGRAAQRWWWQRIPGRRRWGGLASGALPAILLDQPGLLPALLRLLHERGHAAAVVAGLAPVDARSALRAMAAAHAIEAPAEASRQAGPLVQPSGVSAPWRPWLAEPAASAASLTPDGEMLLGVALALACAPAVARQPDFPRAVERWRQAQDATAAGERTRPSTRLAEAKTGRPGADQPHAPAASEAFAESSQTAPPGQPGGAAPSSENAPASQPRAERRHDPDQEALVPAGPSAPVSVEARPDVLPDVSARSGPQDPAVVRSASARYDPAPAPSAGPQAASGVVTGLAGVLFLINVMRPIDLPDCFEPEWRLASQVGPWGLLELVGRALLLDAAGLPAFPRVDNLADLAADPLWAALAQLDGRQPAEPAGAAVTGPDHVQIPAAWARWLGADGMAGLRVDLAGVAPLDGPLLAGASRAMRCWLAVVTPLLCAALARALRIEGDRDPAAELLFRRGQLYVTSSHVDLVLPPESVSLPVRLAGLDFDPGWLPAFGRVVQFHYR